MVPVTYYAASLDFNEFALYSSLLRLVAIGIDIFILKAFIKFPVGKMIARLLPIFACSVVMFTSGWVLDSICLPTIPGIIMCVIVYALCCEIFPSTRKQLNSLYSRFL